MGGWVAGWPGGWVAGLSGNIAISAFNWVEVEIEAELGKNGSSILGLNHFFFLFLNELTEEYITTQPDEYDSWVGNHFDLSIKIENLMLKKRQLRNHPQ